MEKSKIKVKRKQIDWLSFLHDLSNFEIEGQFYLLLQKHPSMSLNRIAYNVLKRHFSTTVLNRIRYVGVVYE